jgi:hypothetical protein
MEIIINNKSINLKRTFRSLIAYEQAMGKAFNPTTITESIMYFYCVIIASDTTLELTYDDFINWLDDNPKALQEFTDWLVKQSEIEGKLAKKKTVKTTRKK